jgi:hypothetical protein
MTSPLTHEINRTVAKLAAGTRLYPTAAGESADGLQQQRMSRPQFSNAGSLCSRNVQPMYGARTSDDVLAGHHPTSHKGRQMVWLEYKDGSAYVKVDGARYDDWKKKRSMDDVETVTIGRERDVVSSRS